MAITPPPAITPAPAPAPQRSDRDTFSDRVDAFVTWVSAAPAQFQALASNVYGNAQEAYARADEARVARDYSFQYRNEASIFSGSASGSASSASTSAASASSSAASAAASAASASAVTGIPSITGNATKSLRVNAAATAMEWVQDGAALGYTPVQQGGGAGQDSVKVYIGRGTGTGALKATVGGTDLGYLATSSTDPATVITAPAFAGNGAQLTGLTAPQINTALTYTAADQAKVVSGETPAGFTSNGTGAVLRTAQQKLLEIPRSLFDYRTANTTAGNTAAIPLAVAAYKYPVELVVTGYDNIYGQNIAPLAIAHNRDSGRAYNPSQQFTARTFGQETMQHWFACFAGASNKNSGDTTVRRMVLSGPSTIDGVGGTYAKPAALMEDLAESRGYTNVGVFNRGQPGKSSADWLADYLDGDLALNPDLLVLQWPVNDPFYDITVEQTLANIKSGLTRIRAAKTVAELSVIVMSAAPMNDVDKGRTEVRAEQLNLGLRQLAADFTCAFFDTNGYYQNAHDAAGIWMDKDTTFYAPGRAIHPLDVFYEHIFGRLAHELVFPDWGTGWLVNLVRNCSAGDTASIKTGAETPSAYFSGIGMHRATPGSVLGAPYDGALYTFKQADGVILQVSAPLLGSGAGVSMRFGFNNQWSQWLGSPKNGALILQNGWTDTGTPFANFTYTVGLDGRTSLNGVISAGVKTDGTAIFQLPPGVHPTATEILLIATENGTCKLQIAADGIARIYGFGSGGNYLSLSGVSFRAGLS